MDQFGIHFAVPTISMLWWFNGDYFDKTGTKSALNTPETMEAYQWFLDLKNKYNVMPERVGDMSSDMSLYQLFMANRVAMFIGTHFYKAEFSKIRDFEWDIAMLPKGKNGKRRIFNNICCFVILKSSKNPDNAWKLLKFLVDREYQEILSRNHNDMPVLKSVLNSTVFLESDLLPKSKKVFVDTLQYTSTHSPNKDNEITDVMNRELGLAIMPFPQKTVKDACEEAARQINVLLEKQIK